MFIPNKYTTWYYNIINNSKNRTLTGYVEKHHIIPKSLDGDNSLDNIAILTAREHFVCHLLLVKMTTGHYKKLMQFAVGKFIQTTPTQKRVFTSWEYNKIRSSISLARTGKKHSKETREKMSQNMKGRKPWNKGVIGITHSPESNTKRSITLTGQPKSNTHRDNISKGKTGHTAGMSGKSHTAETREKMSQNMKGLRGPQTRIDVCPFCSKNNVTYRHIKFCT
jgi:hypothetical protein